jgi:ferritin-like metal-binding protein YciE
MATITSLRGLLVEELRDLYDAEQQLTKALRTLTKKASDGSLRTALEKHSGETEHHIERLTAVFNALGEPARRKTCKAIAALIDEGATLVREADAGPTRDAVIIAAAQKTEHYEIAGYGTVRTYASMLGHEKAAQLLIKNLEEERAADATLTTIAVEQVNEAAAEQRDQPSESVLERSAKRAGEAVAAVATAGQRALAAAGLTRTEGRKHSSPPRSTPHNRKGRSTAKHPRRRTSS